MWKEIIRGNQLIFALVAAKCSLQNEVPEFSDTIANRKKNTMKNVPNIQIVLGAVTLVVGIMVNVFTIPLHLLQRESMLVTPTCDSHDKFGRFIS